VSKKIFIALVLLMLLLSLAACKTSLPQQDLKVVKFDSVPQGANVFVDNQKIGQTPIELKLYPGYHCVTIRKEGFEDYNETINVTNDENPKEVVAKLEKQPEFLCGHPLCFVEPTIRYTCCGGVYYSGVYLNGTYNVRGYTTLDSFDIVFPSGKKVHFDTEQTSDKFSWGEQVRKFSKKVAFDELGEYKVMHNGEIVTPTSGGPVDFKFKVLYKAKILNGKILGSLSGNPEDNNKILLPVWESIDLKLLLTDANGNIARNKLIGLDNLKTDNNGIATIKVKSDLTKDSPFEIYGEIRGWLCEYTKFDSNGNLIKADFVSYDEKGNPTQYIPKIIPNKVNVIKENGHIYMPYNSAGFALNELGFVGNVNYFYVHPKNPSIIYTNSSVSKDGGKTFEKFDGGIFFDEVAVDPKHPSVIFGWKRQGACNSQDGILMESKDYGMHFSKITDLKSVRNIVVDPQNPRTIYVTTEDSVLVSKNGGKDWEKFFNSPCIPWINPHNNMVILMSGYKFTGTEDGGKTWNDLNFFKDRPREWNEPVAFAFDPVKPSLVYGITSSHIFKSEDNGNNWTLLNQKYFSDLEAIAIDPKDNSKIYIATNQGILVSTDYGKTFNTLVSYVYSFAWGENAATLLTVDKNGTVYAILAHIPFKIDSSGSLLPVNESFISSGPKWKIVNGILYLDVKTIKSYNVVVDVTDKDITFYRLYYIGP